MQMIHTGEPFKIFDADAAAAPVNSAGYAIASPDQAKMIGWQTAFASAPSACTIRIQHSINGVDWVTIDESTATGGEIKTTAITPALFIRAVKQAQTGGGALTLTVIIAM